MSDRPQGRMMKRKDECWYLNVCGDFSASHCLRHYEGKCEALHGHNFSVEICVCGSTLDPKIGILVDFKKLKRMMKDVLSRFDHCHLNDLPEFSALNPSSEHLARFVYEGMEKRLQGLGVSMVWAMVAENSGSKAYYTRTTCKAGLMEAPCGP